jgi:hypothetical protein
VETLGKMARVLADKDATVHQLRQMLLKPANDREDTRRTSARAFRATAVSPCRRRRKSSRGKGMGASRRTRLWQRRRWAFHIRSRVTDVRSARKGNSIH